MLGDHCAHHLDVYGPTPLSWCLAYDYRNGLLLQPWLRKSYTSFVLVIFSMWQHICYSALYAIARLSVCPSVRPSVCLSVTRVDQSKMVEVRIMQLTPQSSPMTSFLVVNFTAKFQREHRNGGAK